MIALYTSYLYARSILERAFLEAGAFAHVTEKQMAKAFDDVEVGTAEPFDYNPYVPNGISKMLKKPDNDYDTKFGWECSVAFRPGPKGFVAEPMARLIQHRHGLLCHVCMNPTAEYWYPYALPFENELSIGRCSYGAGFPNVCADCLPLAHLASHAWGDELQFVNTVQRQLRKEDSPLLKRLRSAPALRFEPRSRNAA